MKYIFIDSNQYRHIFSKSEGFSDEVYQLIINLIDGRHTSLVLPQQTKEEVERNKFRAWPDNLVGDIESKIEKLQATTEEIIKSLGKYKSHEKLLQEINNEISQLVKEKETVRKAFVDNKSKANKKLKKLFEKAVFIPETEEIRASAIMRSHKGNPPYDEKVGDSLIWESLLSFMPKRAELIFVANDKRAWGEAGFDKWLEREFKNKTRGKIFYSNRLSDIPNLTVEEQEKIRKEELENLKQNAIYDFINSPSFVSAGERAHRLLKYTELFTLEDYRQIINASISNHEIYQSFFTTTPLMMLTSGKDGYVKKEIEHIDADVWEQFSKTYSLDLKRQSDKSQQPKQEQEQKIPF